MARKKRKKFADTLAELDAHDARIKAQIKREKEGIIANVRGTKIKKRKKVAKKKK